MKIFAMFVVVAFCLGLTACSKDAEVNAFIAEFDAATKEIVSKIDANPTAAGIDDAQKAFDAKKAGLKEKRAATNSLFGVSSDAKKKLQESNRKNVVAMSLELPKKLDGKLAPGEIEKFGGSVKNFV